MSLKMGEKRERERGGGGGGGGDMNKEDPGEKYSAAKESDAFRDWYEGGGRTERERMCVCVFCVMTKRITSSGMLLKLRKSSKGETSTILIINVFIRPQ